MKASLLILHVVILLTIAVSAESAKIPKKETDTLVLLHVLFRHGNRTPEKASLFPSDPNLNQNYEPYGYGQLTNKGKKTMYEVGRYLRQTYDNFISDQYTPNIVQSLSSNAKRTEMSLQLVLAGLFPPLSSDLFAVGLNWQPIPFNIENGEGLLNIPILYCPNYIIRYYSYLISDEGQENIANYKDLYKNLTINTGLDVIDPLKVLEIYVTLKSEEDYGLDLPKWATEVYPKILEEAGSIYYEFSTYNPTLNKLSAGPLLKKILEDSMAKRNGILPEETKVFLYSGHDFNVATMLRALGVFYRQVPPFGATIFFEIHNIEGEYGLKLFYQDYTETKPKLLTIPGCSSFCQLDTLYELVKENLPGENDGCTYLAKM